MSLLNKERGWIRVEGVVGEVYKNRNLTTFQRNYQTTRPDTRLNIRVRLGRSGNAQKFERSYKKQRDYGQQDRPTNRPTDRPT